MRCPYDPKNICEKGGTQKEEERCGRCCSKQNGDDCTVIQPPEREKLEIGYYYHGEMYDDHKSKA